MSSPRGGARRHGPSAAGARPPSHLGASAARATDTFIFNSAGKITRQNVVVHYEAPKTSPETDTGTTKNEQREIYIKEKVSPFLDPLARACLRGLPVDCAGYMLTWLRARSAGHAEPEATGAKSEMSREDYAAKIVGPLMEPMVTEVLRELPTDPIAKMIVYLEKRGVV